MSRSSLINDLNIDVMSVNVSKITTKKGFLYKLNSLNSYPTFVSILKTFSIFSKNNDVYFEIYILFLNNLTTKNINHRESNNPVNIKCVYINHTRNYELKMSLQMMREL